MRTLLLFALLALAACKPAPEAPPPPPAAPPLHDLQTIHVTLPDGWKKAGFGDRDLVAFETALADGRTAILRLKRAGGLPATAAAYFEYKKERYWNREARAEIVAQEALPGGFAMTVRVAASPADPSPNLEYHAVRDAGGEKILCETDWAPTEAIRAQMAAICVSASFAS